MLKKKNRVGRKMIGKIFKEGRFLNSENLTFKFILDKKLTFPIISFTVPKNIVKSAVKRNLLRRRGYTALQKYIQESSRGLMGVFVFKTCPNGRSVGREYQAILENEIRNIFNKIN